MGFFDDLFDSTGDLGCVAALLFVIIAPIYYIVKLLIRLAGWLSDSFARWAGNVFDSKES